MTKIEWTDVTWNPVRGCTKVSPGCKHCYAETFAERWRGIPGHPYEQGFDLRLVPDKLDEPLRWKKPRRVFVNSMSDLFHEDVPNEYIAAVFGIMAATPEHTYQVLTKRSKRMREWFAGLDAERDQDGDVVTPTTTCADSAFFLARDEHGRCVNMRDDQRLDAACYADWPLPNVWLGVSAEDQHRADERIPDLLATPAAVRFVSVEPMLGPVDLRQALTYGRGPETSGAPHLARMRGIDWVICGGESGPGARPMHPEWPFDLRDQCQAAGAAFFFKQWGEFAPMILSSGRSTYVSWDGRASDKPTDESVPWVRMDRVGKKTAGRLLDGREWNEFPEVTK